MPTKKKDVKRIDTTIQTLGPAKIPSNMPYCRFMEDSAATQVNFAEDLDDGASASQTLKLELAGPRKNTYFDPSKTKCAIVTCGGLCPGINDVIRAIVMEAHHNYNVAATLGIRYGLQGFIPKYGHPIEELTPRSVSDIHMFGGTILGSSRGPQPADEIVDALERMNISVLFLIGGDGTMQAAASLLKEIQDRNLKISVIGIPKTIDNDINFIYQSFGFDTAVEASTIAINCAHTEATGAYNGIGMVKLMGRESGFIAAQASLALKVVNFVLVPEAPFTLEGEGGLLEGLERRLADRGHAVIVVAEGAGQDISKTSGETDASGNPILGDICTVLRREIKAHFERKGIEHTLKFIDPSYIIRSVPANANDRVYCGFLGQHAVHAAMSGKTGMVISKMRGHFIHLPLHLVTGQRRRINIGSDYWRSVLESTGQFLYMSSCFG
ncbi:6-phosphofructokinase 1 [Desulfobaculum xiamenense]|uniref:6-phosphofructokinase 1 n=1 Tax=Desulfobaculum xiamenense TaxID=995050 RepID=A0A846QQY8_9BACT|nr:ATP-dependent 6-phosphofructokinase [Desulfobaculum xiamenense]NJB69400.1 6-phosphofructokinase 1 [Desulfobaculum xiamenense]